MQPENNTRNGKKFESYDFYLLILFMEADIQRTSSAYSRFNNNVPYSSKVT